MKTLDLTAPHTSLEEVLEVAREEPVLLKGADGESFLLSPADEFALEVEILRRDHTFLTFLDEAKKSTEAIPIEDLERDLR